MNETKELLAWVQHSIWSHWMTYLFGVCKEQADGSVVIPATKVTRWKRQMNTDFHALPESEQASDYHQAEKVMDILGL